MRPIETEEYAAAVRLLTALAQTDTSGGRGAAQVVLSAYNGDEWQLDVTEPARREALCGRSECHRGRVELMMEPHKLIPDGQ